MSRKLALVPPKAEAVSPDDLLEALPLLVNLKYISPSSYALGAQVCMEMKRLGVRQLIYDWRVAVQSYVRSEEGFLVGPPTDSDTIFVEALQDLHFRGGLLNAFDEARLNEEDCWERHVTLSPTQHINCHYSRVTPIYFRITDHSRDSLYNWLEVLVQREIGKCTRCVGVAG